MHTHKHLFADIQAKEATCNYNTKPNEKLYGALKDIYNLQTNKRNVADQVFVLSFIFPILFLLMLVQILKIDHYTLVMFLFQQWIALLDENHNSEEVMDVDEADTEDNIRHKPSRTTILSAGHVSLRACQDCFLTHVKHVVWEVSQVVCS